MVIFYKIEHPIEREAHRKRIPLRKMIESFQGKLPDSNESRNWITEDRETRVDIRILSSDPLLDLDFTLRFAKSRSLLFSLNSLIH